MLENLRLPVFRFAGGACTLDLYRKSSRQSEEVESQNREDFLLGRNCHTQRDGGRTGGSLTSTGGWKFPIPG